MCEDCIKLLTDAQAEAKANSSFIDSLIENIEKQCDMLGPGLADQVNIPCVGFFTTPRRKKNKAFLIPILLSLQCKQYVSQYGTLVVQQLMSMVSLLVPFDDVL